MPAILTHYNLALETPLGTGAFADVVRVGTQGPDVFMAYGTVPWRKKKDKAIINPVGAALHHVPVEESYGKMIAYASAHPEKEMLYAYIESALMHYALDRLAHPYIFYRSGFDENGELHGFYKWSHGAFEAILDKGLSQRKGTYQRPYKCLLAQEQRIREISKMWAACTSFGLQEDSFYEAWKDYIAAMKLIYSPTGIKKKIIGLLLGKTSAAYAQSMPRSLKKYAAMDIQNLTHAAWKDPATGEEHHESIDDLFELAKKDMGELHAILEEAKQGKDVTSALKKWGRNLDHDGTPYDGKKRYQDVCFPKIM